MNRLKKNQNSIARRINEGKLYLDFDGEKFHSVREVIQFLETFPDDAEVDIHMDHISHLPYLVVFADPVEPVYESNARRKVLLESLDHEVVCEYVDMFGRSIGVSNLGFEFPGQCELVAPNRLVAKWRHWDLADDQHRDEFTDLKEEVKIIEWEEGLKDFMARAFPSDAFKRISIEREPMNMLSVTVVLNA